MKSPIFIIILSAFFMQNVRSQVNLNTGLAAYYPFNDSAIDASGNGFNGSTLNNPIHSVDILGNTNAAYQFNGTNTLIALGDILDSIFAKTPASKFSITGWAKTDSLSLVQGDNVILSKSGGGASGPYQWYIAHEYDGKITSFISYVPGSVSNAYELKSTTAIPTNTWFAYVVTYDGTQSLNSDRLKLYVNGVAGIVSRNLGAGGTTTQNTTQQITIGGSYNGTLSSPINNYLGLIDEIRIYNRVLNNDEIDFLSTPPDTFPKVDLKRGLKTYWAFDGNALDSSGNNYNGTNVSVPTYVSDRMNRASSAVHFDGSTQFIRFGDILDSVFAKKPASNFSISGWIKPDALPNKRSVFLSKSAGGTGPYEWYMYVENDGRMIAVVTSTETGPNNWVEITSSNALRVNRWSHFVMTFNGNKSDRTKRVNLYLDGVPGVVYTNVGVLATTCSNTNQEITIGASHVKNSPTTPANQFLGAMDDVRIHDRVLHSEEIQSLAMMNPDSAEFINIKAGLMAYYPFSDNANDYSGNAFHGIPYNSPSVAIDINGYQRNAYQFNGTSTFIALGDILDSVFTRTPAAQFTVSGWANTDSISAIQGDNVMIAKSSGGASGPYQWYIAHENDGKITAFLSYVSGSVSNAYEIKSVNAIPAHSWFNFVMTYDGTQFNNNDRLKLFINNTAGIMSRNLGTGGKTTQNTAQQITIGGTYNSSLSSPINIYKGVLDEIRIYNRVLNTKELKELTKLPVSVPADTFVGVDINKGLQGYWKLDNNAADSSGNNYHGTEVSSPQYVKDRIGNDSSAMHFDGITQFVRCGDILDTIFTSPSNATFSISGWVKPDAFPDKRSVILGKSAGGTGPYEWYIYLDNDGKLVAAVATTAYGPTDYVEVKSYNALTNYRWSHFVMTFNGKEISRNQRIQLYVDTLAGIVTNVVGNMSTSCSNTDQQLTFGASHAANTPSTPANQFAGSLDEIRIHNRVIKRDEINLLASMNPDTLNTINLLSGLAGYWPLDSNTNDFSGNHFDGTTLNNPPYIIDRLNRNNGAMHVNGNNQFVKIGDILDSIFCETPYSTFSVSGWLKPDNRSSRRQAIVAKAAGGTGPYQWYIYLDNDGHLVGAFCSAAFGPTNYVEKKSIDTISLMKWTHFVMTFDGSRGNRQSRINLYTNTIKGNPFTDVGTMGTYTENNNQELTFGSGHVPNNPFQPNNQYLGALDEIRIHNKLLNYKEIDSLYHLVPEYLTSIPIHSFDDNQFVIYPNPAEDVIYIKLENSTEQISVDLFDLFGKLVLHETIQSTEQSINISQLPEALYIIRVKHNEFYKTGKVLRRISQ